jgi:hypothetical protein
LLFWGIPVGWVFTVWNWVKGKHKDVALTFSTRIICLAFKHYVFIKGENYLFHCFVLFVLRQNKMCFSAAGFPDSVQGKGQLSLVDRGWNHQDRTLQADSISYNYKIVLYNVT